MKEAFKTARNRIHRSPYQAFAATMTMFLSFFLSTLVVLVALGSQTVLHYFETRPQVTAFFKEDVTSEGQLDDLKDKLKSTGKIQELKYVSKEDALTIYRDQNKNDPLLLEMVTADILPASLEVATTDLSVINEIADVLKQDALVEEVIFQEDVVSNLRGWTDAVRKLGVVLVAVLGIISLLIILIIVGLKIAAKKDEVETLKLLGASPGFIKLPFVLEGTYYGLLGAFAAWVAVYIVLLYSTPLLLKFFSGVPLLPIPVVLMLEILGVELLVGMLIGILGSTLALKRYMR